MQTYSKCACFFTPIKHLVLLNKTYSTDIKTIVNFKKPYVVSQLPYKGALPPWTPAPAGEAKEVPSEMTGVSFVQ